MDNEFLLNQEDYFNYELELDYIENDTKYNINELNSSVLYNNFLELDYELFEKSLKLRTELFLRYLCKSSTFETHSAAFYGHSTNASPSSHTSSFFPSNNTHNPSPSYLNINTSQENLSSSSSNNSVKDDDDDDIISDINKHRELKEELAKIMRDFSRNLFVFHRKDNVPSLPKIINTKNYAQTLDYLKTNQIGLSDILIGKTYRIKLSESKREKKPIIHLLFIPKTYDPNATDD